MISAISPRGRFLGSPSSPQTPATTNYFLLVTETQSSEGRGIFCYCSYQDKFKSIPTSGTQFELKLVFKAFNWGHWEFTGGLDLILDLQNSHVLSLLGPFSGLVGVAPIVWMSVVLHRTIRPSRQWCLER